MIHDDGTEEAGDGTDAIGHAHEDTRVPRGDVQVVDVEAGDCEPAESDAGRQRRRGLRVRLRVRHNYEEDRLHAETSTVEHFANHRRRHSAGLS